MTYKTTETELFEKIVNHFKLPTIFARHQSFWLGPEYASGLSKEEQMLPLTLSNCGKILHTGNITTHLQTLNSDGHVINSNSR